MYKPNNDLAFADSVVYITSCVLLVFAAIVLIVPPAISIITPLTTTNATIEAIYLQSNQIVFTTTDGGYYFASYTLLEKIRVGKSYTLYLKEKYCCDAVEIRPQIP